MTMIKILVRSTLKSMVLDVESSDTIGDVKKKIYDHDGTPPERQRLTYDGRELRHDDCTVSDYGINDDHLPKIELVRRRHAPIRIVITSGDGRTRITTLDDVEVTDTVRSIKARIRDKVGICVDRQTLYFEYTLMEDRRIIAEYSIVRNHDTLELQID